LVDKLLKDADDLERSKGRVAAASAITSLGRFVIYNIYKQCVDFYNGDKSVLMYSDTDSIYLSVPKDNLPFNKLNFSIDHLDGFNNLQ
jgi:hypothetical protein